MSKIPISVCIIAKNEEKYIEECLKRLQPYGFEIVVTDTGSTDRTKEIAQKYADKVLDFEWINDFSAARNFCAQHASNAWILSIDCDEYVSSIDVATLRILMQKFPRYTGVIRLKNLVIEADGKQGYGTDDVTRFYNRNYYGFDYPIHEQVCSHVLSEREEKMQCFLMPMEVVHHGYALPPEEMKEKQRRNLELLYRNLKDNPAEPYTLFQIAQSEFILGNNEKAIECYEKGLALEPSPEFVYVQVMIISLAKAYVKVDREPDALELMNRYADSCKTAKFVFTHAGVYLDNKQPLKALLLYVKTTMLPDADTLGENLMHCYEHIISLYRDMGDDKMADLFQGKYEACAAERERVMNS
ncbi:MAG: glycosyltransferase family 2 protein [Lachnospiraceae bacterium]|nr:glycosyltransferase family 2 protein [Lachnospiraceae bacterium]